MDKDGELYIGGKSGELTHIGHVDEFEDDDYEDEHD